MLCRIVYAIINKRWASKLGAVEWASQTLDPQWRDLITFAAECYPSSSAPPACPWTMADLKRFAEDCTRYADKGTAASGT